MFSQCNQNHSFVKTKMKLFGNKSLCRVYKSLFSVSRECDHIMKALFLHLTLHILIKFNLSGKCYLRYIFLNISGDFLLKVRWKSKCYPLFFVWYICVPGDSTYSTLKWCSLLFLWCLHSLLVLLAFDSF